MKRMLSVFDYSNHMRDAFKDVGYQAYSLDLDPGLPDHPVDFVCNILEFDYKKLKPGHYSFLFIALPCQCYSIASGAFHFKKGVPVTSSAHTAIKILKRIYQITKYFNCHFIIENPSGGLINNPFFQKYFSLNVSRLPLSNFGFPTPKKTDLFYNFDMLLLSNPVYRKNGLYGKQKLDNLSYRKRVTYPKSFAAYIADSYINFLKSESRT